MLAEPSAILAHVSVGTNDFAKARAFYIAVMETIGANVIMDLEFGQNVGAIAFGKQHPEFWVQSPHDQAAATAGNGVHVAFQASSKEMVHAFWDKALEMGATPDGEPGPRPHYSESYYGCFVRDLDGNKIEAVHIAIFDEFKGD